MGLLAIVASRARRVGLLPRVIQALPLVSVLLAVAGLVLMATLPMEGSFRSTYASENALMSHQAITFFRESDWDVMRGLLHEIGDISASETRHERLIELFGDYNLAPYESGNHTAYAISPASRGPQNEAIVIAAPWECDGGKLNQGGVALLVGLARSFQTWSFWHKNLIFVVPNTAADLREFVSAYHTSLQHTAGNIEGAVVLEYAGDSQHFSSVEVLFEGLNGQLPNLDLVNVAIHSTRAEFSRPEVLNDEDTNNYMGRLRTMLSHIHQQASAGIVPNTAAAMFSGWRIDAVTLRAHFASDGGSNPYDITTFGRVCESTARSINNLLEHFHQSFFFYLMLGTNYFVSIASFLPAVMLVAGGFSVMALYWLFNSSAPTMAEAAQVGVAASLITVLSSACGYSWAIDAHVVAASAGTVLVGAAVALSFVLGHNTRRMLYAVALALAGLEVSALAMINFSLALVLGTLMVPLAWIRPTNSFVSHVCNASIVAFACPATLLGLLAKYYFSVSTHTLVVQTVNAFRNYTVWTWMVVWCTWVPMWIAAAISA